MARLLCSRGLSLGNFFQAKGASDRRKPALQEFYRLAWRSRQILLFHRQFTTTKPLCFGQGDTTSASRIKGARQFFRQGNPASSSVHFVAKLLQLSRCFSRFTIVKKAREKRARKPKRQSERYEGAYSNLFWTICFALYAVKGWMMLFEVTERGGTA